MSTVLPPDVLETGDTPVGPVIRFTFIAPSDVWIQKLIYGLMAHYSDPATFFQVGTMTPESAAEMMSGIWETLNLINYTGQIILFAGIAPPSDTLLCDGASYLRTAYPALFAAIGVLWGSVDSTHFNVPDLRGRVPVDAGTGSGLSPRTITDTGGEEVHTLSSGEMPAHTHGGIPTFVNTAAGLEAALASLEIPLITVPTGSTGGGGSHNTMQPFVVVNYAIVT